MRCYTRGESSSVLASSRESPKVWTRFGRDPAELAIGWWRRRAVQRCQAEKGFEPYRGENKHQACRWLPSPTPRNRSDSVRSRPVLSSPFPSRPDCRGATLGQRRMRTRPPVPYRARAVHSGYTQAGARSRAHGSEQPAVAKMVSTTAVESPPLLLAALSGCWLPPRCAQP